jgi:hypothetical protein
MQNHIRFLEMNEDYIWLQRCFQDSNTENQLFSPWDDERKVKYGHSNLVSNFSFSEIFEETGDNQSSESLSLKTLDNELVYDEYTSQSENAEEECNVLGTYECEVTCHSPLSFENMNSEFPGIQDQILVEQEQEFLIDEGSEYMSFLFDMHVDDND